MNVLGYNVFNRTLSEIDFSKKTLINTFSPNSYGIARNDKALENALKNTDLLVLDGMGIAIGSILLNGKNIKKIAGQDCFDFLMDKANANKWKVFFLGSSESTLAKIRTRAAHEYPLVKVGTYSPPFRTEFSREENEEMIMAINRFEPRILFVGMTAPKQEKWAYQFKEKINANVISTIGNVFDWYAGNSKRPASIWIKLRLEWFIRIFMRPEILKRNTKNQLRFFKDLLLHITHIQKIR
ncbi:MAG TPA: WecB/TagA/CpsF family glycosyltransferase [Flavitalea sp.]|nr:WecB/TagA/CpsF family glycosyltransferase [Flavitalea sp.]